MIKLFVFNGIAVFVRRDLSKNVKQFLFASFQVGDIQHTKTFLGNLVKPPTESDVCFFCVFLLVGGNQFAFHILLVNQSHIGLCQNSVVLQPLGRFVGFVNNQGFITHFQLVEVNRWHLHFSHSGKTLDLRAFFLGFTAKLLQSDVLLLLQLLVQSVRIELVHPNQSGFHLMLFHLAETTATGLQHHIGWTYTFLWKNDTRQALAVPAFFTDLDEQHNSRL